MTIQELLAKASDRLSESYKNHKVAQETLKELKKELKNELKNNDQWNELEQRKKEIKNARKDMTQQIKDADKAQDQIAAELEQYKAVQDFAVDAEDKYTEEKDKQLNALSRELTEKGVIAEIEYRSGRLILIVAKH